ncbi:hypothetical protein [Escherichia phage vB_EcoM_JNE01]|nr:hypothetical protein [Escherichia phage vB_EcoM_JNE01]
MKTMHVILRVETALRVDTSLKYANNSYDSVVYERWVKLDKTNTLRYISNTNKFDVNSENVPRLAHMSSEEVFQYSLVHKHSADLKVLKAVQEALLENNRTRYVTIEVDAPDYMLDDDEFYEKHFPKKQWRD